jgi:hypothetical protein
LVEEAVAVIVALTEPLVDLEEDVVLVMLQPIR